MVRETLSPWRKSCVGAATNSTDDATAAVSVVTVGSREHAAAAAAASAPSSTGTAGADGGRLVSQCSGCASLSSCSVDARCRHLHGCCCCCCCGDDVRQCRLTTDSSTSSTITCRTATTCDQTRLTWPTAPAIASYEVLPDPTYSGHPAAQILSIIMVHCPSHLCWLRHASGMMLLAWKVMHATA